jgi:hypothetical protein
MRKIISLSILLISFTCVKAQYYQLGFDSVRVKSKFKLGAVATGSTTDSLLTKKANGGVYKVSRADFAPLASPTGSGTATWVSLVGTTSVTAGSMIIQNGTAFGTGSNGMILISSSAGAAYPFLSNSNLVFQSRGSANADIVFATSTTQQVRAYIKGATGNLHVGYTDGSDAAYKLAVNGSFLATTGQITTAPSTGNDIVRLADLNSFANYTASGDGSTTAITITHGLSGISGTSKVIVQPLNAASAGVTYVSISSTQVTINYTVAPVSGSSNLSYSILIKP